ncbi:protein abrupt-like [Planococcus citri]|uniref:protein abrupt-like n=1 Tax=Planococcus citri TaxID=170843 RepID=UPI0031F84443
MNVSFTCNFKQNNFQSGIFSFLQKFRQDEHFLDVLLNCKGGEIHAHRIVLSLYSPYFYDKLKEHVDPQTSLSLENIPINIMQALLKFMYEGEVNLDAFVIHDFLKFGHELKISGFPSNEDDTNISSFTQETAEEEMKNLSIVSSDEDKGCNLSNNVESRKDETESDPVDNLIDPEAEDMENSYSDLEEHSIVEESPNSLLLAEIAESPTSPCLAESPKFLNLQVRSANRAGNIPVVRY